MNDDGSMARRPDLETFAREHDLKIGTIADLIQYRLHHEATIERLAEHDMDTWYGGFRLITYRDRLDCATHLALGKGDISTEHRVPVPVPQTDPPPHLNSPQL